MKCVKCGKEFNPTINADMDSYYSFKMGMCKDCGLKELNRGISGEVDARFIGTPLLWSNHKMKITYDIRKSIVFVMEDEYAVSLNDEEVDVLMSFLKEYKIKREEVMKDDSM